MRWRRWRCSSARARAHLLFDAQPISFNFADGARRARPTRWCAPRCRRSRGASPAFTSSRRASLVRWVRRSWTSKLRAEQAFQSSRSICVWRLRERKSSVSRRMGRTGATSGPRQVWNRPLRTWSRRYFEQDGSHGRRPAAFPTQCKARRLVICHSKVKSATARSSPRRCARRA